MSPKPRPDPSRASFITILALCCAVAAIAFVVVPTARNMVSYLRPETGTIRLNLNPAACKSVLRNEQSSIEPCSITALYGFDPATRDLVLFLNSGEARLPNWKTDIHSINGEPFAP